MLIRSKTPRCFDRCYADAAMSPSTKLVLAGLLLLFALGFYFFGEALLDTAEAPVDPAPTPTAFLPSSLALLSFLAA
jgi:hypothetical protein